MHLLNPRATSLGLSDGIREKAIEIMKEGKETIAAKGWAPAGTAAAAIYLAMTLRGEVGYQEEKEIAKVAGTTPITIGNRYKELKKGNSQNDIRNTRQ